MQKIDMDEALYQKKLEEIFVRFPSVQSTGFGDAYKPGLAHMEAFDGLLGQPSRSYRTLHVAGTNGKGSVANMLASALAATGLKVGLYTSPHILDFRERMRILDAGSDGPARLIGKEAVWDFLCRWEKTFDELELSFFEITTGMAFRWFADEKVDVAVIEVGLGGRLDSTNIITPEVAVITSIGLDHCAMLGDTRAAIAGEKAGIFKPGVPAVVGTRDAETAPVFEQRAASLGCPLFFADAPSSGASCCGGQRDCSAFSSASAKCSAIPLPPSTSAPDNCTTTNTAPSTSAPEKCTTTNTAPSTSAPDNCTTTNTAHSTSAPDKCTTTSTAPSTSAPDKCQASGLIARLASMMDLQGEWQEENLRTVLTVLSIMGVEAGTEVRDAIAHTARRMDFHGRWEMIGRSPDMLCDIGHNPPALKRNFAQLEQYVSEGRYDRLIFVYGVMADKDLDGILPLMPRGAAFVAVAPDTARAMKATALYERLRAALPGPVLLGGSVAEGLEKALGLAAAAEPLKPLIYIGGSTFVVSEAVAALNTNTL